MRIQMVRFIERRRPWVIWCGHCKHAHTSIDTVKACSTGAEIFRCTWLVSRGWHEDYELITECGADAWLLPDDRGFACAAGHSHINCETRAREGWDYADSPEEAEALRKAGVDAVAMNGGPI